MIAAPTEASLDADEDAAFVGLHPDTLRARAAAGIIRGAKPGKEWRFLLSDLIAYLRRALGDPPLYDVNDALLREGLGALGAAHYNRLVNVVRAALNLAALRGWIERAPRITRRKVERAEPRGGSPATSGTACARPCQTTCSRWRTSPSPPASGGGTSPA